MAIKRLDLPSGDWLDVKEKLKIGDKANLQSYASDGFATDRQSFNYNIVKHQIGTTAIRVLNWSLKDGDKPIEYPVGKPFEERAAAIANLDEERFLEVFTAVETFEASLPKNAQTDGATA